MLFANKGFAYFMFNFRDPDGTLNSILYGKESEKTGSV